MGIMHITGFKTGALAGQASRTHGGKTTFVCQFGERVRLVHELGQLWTAEELPDRSNHRSGINQNTGSRNFDGDGAHAFLGDSFQAQQTDTKLILNQFANGTDTPIAQMVDIIFGIFTIIDQYHMADYFDNIFFSERTLAFGDIET